MKPEKLISLIEASGREARSYSGRAMYGKECVSVYLERGDSDSDLPRGARSDCLGRGTVWYWPNVAWPESVPSD